MKTPTNRRNSVITTTRNDRQAHHSSNPDDSSGRSATFLAFRETIFVQFSFIVFRATTVSRARTRNQHIHIIIGFNKVSRVVRVLLNFQRPSRANTFIKIKVIYPIFVRALCGYTYYFNIVIHTMDVHVYIHQSSLYFSDFLC